MRRATLDIIRGIAAGIFFVKSQRNPARSATPSPSVSKSPSAPRTDGSDV
jgi:hypothetical protein